jgi:Zn-dependent protease with chaperone function
MTLAVYLPIVVCGVLAVSSVLLSRRVAPDVGAWLLAATVAAGALSVMWTLLLLVASLIDDVPGLSHGQRPLPVNDAVSVAACAILAWSCVRMERRWRAQVRLRRELRVIPGDGLVVLPDERVVAFVAPGRAGRIVVSRGMLRALTARQRRVLFAHERAHLDAHHPAALTLAHLGAAAVPLLDPVARAVGYLCERHADERAAATVDDREGTAVALATAALASRRQTRVAGRSWPGPVIAGAVRCGFDEGDVVARIRALRRPAHSPSRLVLAGALLAVGLAVGAAIDATVAFVALMAAYTGS